MSSVRTIPVTLVEKNIHIHVRGKVNVGPGDDEHGRGCRNHKGRWRGYIDPDTDVYSRRASIEGAHQCQKRCCHKQYEEYLSFHQKTSFPVLPRFISDEGDVERNLKNLNTMKFEIQYF
jgi:hypothetical protein